MTLASSSSQVAVGERPPLPLRLDPIVTPSQEGIEMVQEEERKPFLEDVEEAETSPPLPG